MDRIETSHAIAEARAQGDISENAEYEAAKAKKQSFIEGRILDIEGKLGNAQIIDPTTLNAEGPWCSGDRRIRRPESEKKSTIKSSAKTRQTSRPARFRLIAARPRPDRQNGGRRG